MMPNFCLSRPTSRLDRRNGRYLQHAGRREAAWLLFTRGRDLAQTALRFQKSPSAFLTLLGSTCRYRTDPYFGKQLENETTLVLARFKAPENSNQERNTFVPGASRPFRQPTHPSTSLLFKACGRDTHKQPRAPGPGFGGRCSRSRFFAENTSQPAIHTEISHTRTTLCLFQGGQHSLLLNQHPRTVLAFCAHVHGILPLQIRPHHGIRVAPPGLHPLHLSHSPQQSRPRNANAALISSSRRVDVLPWGDLDGDLDGRA